MVSSYLSWLWSAQDYMPHGMCLLWQPELIWLHVGSDAAIALAYYVMPVALIYFATKRKDLVFRGLFALTGIFILACGTTHVMGIWTLWHPDYRLDGMIKAITAVASIGTSFAMWRVMPLALALPGTGQLERANRALAGEIDERRRIEAALREANQQLEERSRQLELVNHEIEAFAYSVSHDLRAPLRAMDGFSQALIEDYGATLDVEGKDHLRRIRTGAVRMGRLIDDLLALSRVSRSELKREPLDLSALMRRSFDELSAAEPGRKAVIDIATDCSADADPRLVAIALENLASNAWKFTGKTMEARIAFGVMTREEGAVFFLRDNGAGFDMAYAHKLFTPFQRLHSSAEFAGTGIGLATVARIIRRHGGEIWIESAPEQGTTVFFTL
jgi:light-regulated signal transduction histidine kinase (bacteriophytochrome)